MTIDIDLPQQGKFANGHGVDCGWTLEAHKPNLGFRLEEFNEPRDEYPRSLNECAGYFPEDENVWLEAEMEFGESCDFRRDYHERLAQGRAAWGLHASCVRVQNFEEMTAKGQGEVLKAPTVMRIG